MQATRIAFSNAKSSTKAPDGSYCVRDVKTILTWMRERDEKWFGPIFAQFPSARMVNARVEPTEEFEMDGLLLTGGSDVSAENLHQAVRDPNLILDADPARDQWEIEATKRAVRHDQPVLAICRGLQILNVALGGTLHLHVPGHDSSPGEEAQPLRYLRPARRQFTRVNSSHHQALAKLGSGIEVQAVCETDGVVEQAWMPGRRFVEGTQFHPERGTVYFGLFEDFFANVGDLKHGAFR